MLGDSGEIVGSVSTSNGVQKKLLLDWLKVAESQICSLEVLCEQLPKMNILLEDSMIALGDDFSILASQVQSQSSNMENIFNAVEGLEIDGRDTTLVDELSEINVLAKSSGDAGLSDKISNLLDAATGQKNIINAAVQISKVSSQSMVVAVSNAIVNMQFQDRVSQNLVIADNIAKENVKHLKENIDNTITECETSVGHGRGVLDVEFAKRLISLLTLGELQHQFVDHLIAHGYIASGEELGFEVADTVNDESDDIELF